MSFRPRGGAARRGRSGNRPVYEDFKPTYEWKHEEGAYILLYHLPGFFKEQIRILAESKGLLKIRGERHLTNNKWSRFEEQVTVPEECNMSEIRAKFEGEILKINMPKMATTTEKNQLVEEQPKTTYQAPNIPPKPHHELQEELPPKPTLPTTAQTPQFGTITTPPPPTPWIGGESEPRPERQPKTTTLPTKPPPVDHSKQPNIIQGDFYDSAKANEFTEKHDEAAVHHGMQMHEKHEIYADALDQEKESGYDLSKMNRFDNYKQVMKSRLSKKSLDEDRQLLVNMGAAILVIFALGTSIAYSFGSSG